MDTMYRTISGSITPISDLDLEGIAATSDLCEDGIALVMEGADLSRLKSGNAAVLKNHDCDKNRGTHHQRTHYGEEFDREVEISGAGISTHADETRGLVKDGFFALSLGFGVIESAPIDPAQPRNGRKALRWICYEVSVVSVPLIRAPY